MPDKDAILVIDQGTTSTRVIGFDLKGRALATAQREHKQHYPQSGWVEHDPEEIWQNTLSCLQNARDGLREKDSKPIGIGMTNQRETIVAWDKKTGKVLYNAIVWQDKRTADFCRRLNDTHGIEINNRTGLPADPYFSGSKMRWMLKNVKEIKAAAKKETLAFGTMDSFLLWRLTGGQKHLTDSTNACRTLLFDIHKMAWSDDLLSLFGVPRASLPDVKPNTFSFGKTAKDILPESLLIAAMAGDQHAATFGQACFKEGMVKSTYGTGCFAVMNTGSTPISSENGLLTTLAYHTAEKPVYALEGSIFVAGAGVQWLRDKLEVIESAPATEQLAEDADGNHPGLYFVPAFAGLGAPHWDSAARGAVLGMTLDTDKAAITLSMLEAVCYQSHDLFSAMAADCGKDVAEVRVDGGMVVNDWLCQRLSCLTRMPIRRPAVTETTALGAAWLAGLQLGVYKETTELEKLWQKDAAFKPKMPEETAHDKHRGWQKAVAAVQMYAKN